MTFSKPSTVSGITTPYTYKSGMPSAAQNYIDEQFPNIIDGNGGGTYSGNITLTGPVNFSGILGITSGALIIVNSGGLLDINPGAFLNLTAGSSTRVDGYVTFDLGSTTTFDGYTTFGTTGSLIMQSNSEMNFNNSSLLTLKSGSTTSFNTGSSLQVSGTSTFNSGSITSIVGGANLSINTGASLFLDANIKSSIGNAINYGVSTLAVVNGTNTVSSTIYNNPVINFTGTITGDATIALPNIVGAVWYLNFQAMNFNNNTLNVSVGSSSLFALFSPGVSASTFNYGTTPDAELINIIIVTGSNTFAIK